MSNLEDPLLRRNSSISRVYPIKREELCSWFEPDNVRDGVSLSRIQDLGGIEGLLDRLKVNEKGGLNSSDEPDIAARQKEFGRNDPIIKPPKAVMEFITEQFEDKMLQLLTAASLFSLVIGIINEGLAEGWLEGFAIFIAVFLIVTVTATNNYLRDQQFRKLNSKREQRDVSVIRGGEVTQLSVFSLLVGDIMLISTGENIPVDGIVIKSNTLTIDESSVTGESDLIHKNPPTTTKEKGHKINCFMISGSKVMEGTGVMVVTAVGIYSQNGKNKLKLQEEDEVTPLQLKLENVVDQIGNIGKWCAILTFVGMTLHLVYDNFSTGQSFFSIRTLHFLVEFFMVGVAIIVVAIPEGLPLAVTIALAYSVGKMKEENNLVRHLSACETMGGANNICTDKTGTLTLNIMAVDSIYIEENTHNPVREENIGNDAKKYFSESVSVNSNAWPKKQESGRFEQIGNKTECALLEQAFKFGYDFHKYRGDNAIRQVPFSSARKRMSTVWKFDENSARVYVKGATEVILEKSTRILGKDGKAKSLDQETAKNILNNVVTPFAKKALRTIAIAYKDLPIKGRDVEKIPEEELEDKLTLIAIAGIKDPLRPEIPSAVRKCRGAGITVRMVTGDISETAMSIAMQSGILSPGFERSPDSYVVMEGKVFRQLVGKVIEVEEGGKKVQRIENIKVFKEIADELRVLARSTPEDKYTLVTGLKQLGEVVAVTGDGTNDAPALKKADIGFAMGIMGTEVAKEASGIIILDDNFNSIVTAVKWGRNIFDCIRKFLQFQLTVNIVAMFMVLLGGVVLRQSPFTPSQMLWVNLIMDTFASLALATEPPREELLTRKPYTRTENLVTPVMWRNIIGQAVYQIVWCVIILFFGDTIFGVVSGRKTEIWTKENGVHYTILFNAFVFMQAFNEINARKLKPDEINVFEDFFNNPMFIIVEATTIVVQIIMVEIGGKALHCAPLTAGQHLVCLAIGAGGLIMGVVIKKLPEGIFNSIPLFTHENITVEKLGVSTQGSLRRNPSLKYKTQSSLK